MMKTPLLDAFRTRYPGLRIELMMVDRVLDLAKGEADVAFGTAPAQDNALVSRKLADVPWAMFASRSYVDSHGQPERSEDGEVRCRACTSPGRRRRTRARPCSVAWLGPGGYPALPPRLSP
jgi:DNA-binding transcriptional LysR family regulator